jgi:RNA polymerase sigma-70 factor, ECF subfamily
VAAGGRGLARFRGEEQAFRAWLFTIARHRAADAGRSRVRRPAVPLETSEREISAAEQRLTSPDAADQALEAVATQGAMALIASLPRDQAEIVMLRVVAGLDPSDVARIAGKTSGGVRVAAHRGLRRLASQVGTSPAAPRSARRSLPALSARGRLP